MSDFIFSLSSVPLIYIFFLKPLAPYLDFHSFVVSLEIR